MSSVPSVQGGNNHVPQQPINLFKATIIDQTVKALEQGDTRIVLTALVQGKAKDAHDPSAGIDPSQTQEVEVWLSLLANDDNRLRMAMRDLERLEFKDDDITRLHPDHPNTYRLVGKEIHVRSKIVGDTEYWNLAWPSYAAKTVGLAELQQTTGKLKDRISALRKGKDNGKKGTQSKASE